jgi:hypothetical protein
METNVSDFKPYRTKAELIALATTHGSQSVREAACEAIYQRGRADSANEIAAVLVASPTPASVTP